MSDAVRVEISTAKLTRPTMGLRFVEKGRVRGPDLVLERVLQQAWEVIEYDDNDRATVVEIEWRDVPIVDRPLS